MDAEGRVVVQSDLLKGYFGPDESGSVEALATKAELSLKKNKKEFSISKNLYNGLCEKKYIECAEKKCKKNEK